MSADSDSRFSADCKMDAKWQTGNGSDADLGCDHDWSFSGRCHSAWHFPRGKYDCGRTKLRTETAGRGPIFFLHRGAGDWRCHTAEAGGFDSRQRNR